jgi:hypothetical protein
LSRFPHQGLDDVPNNVPALRIQPQVLQALPKTSAQLVNVLGKFLTFPKVNEPGYKNADGDHLKWSECLDAFRHHGDVGVILQQLIKLNENSPNLRH